MGKLESLLLYLIVYTISALLFFLSKKNKDEKVDFLFVLAVCIPVLLAALRDNVGTDFENYAWMYEGQSKLSFFDWYKTSGMYIDGTPFGIWIVSRIAGAFNSQEVYFGLLAAFIIIPVFLFMKKELSKDGCFLSAFLFLTGTFTTGFNMIKQGIAIAIIIYAMRFVFKRKIFKFLLMIFFAYCFHPSALIASFIYFIWTPVDVKYSVKRMVFICLTIVFVFSISNVLEMVGGRFAAYTRGTDVEFNNRSFYLKVMWCLLFMIFRKKYVEADQRNDLFTTLFIIGVIMSILGFVSPYIKRIALYYTFPQMFLIAQSTAVFTKKDRTFVKIMIFAYAITMFVIGVYILEQADIIPYQFVKGLL